MKVSVIIPTINRYQDLKNTVDDLHAQNLSEFEIIIIDQTEIRDEKIVSKLTDSSNVNYIQANIKSASAARNIGINLSKGEVLLFIDDDVQIKDQNFLNNHYRHYYDLSINGVVGCPLELSINQVPRIYRHWMSFRKQSVGWLYFPSNYGCNTFVAAGRSNNLSVRKSIAVAVGGMDENYKKGAHREEADFCLRVFQQFGPFLFDPQAKLIHIGNIQGGIRSWNISDYIRADHHMVGAIYFSLKMGRGITKFEYGLATLRYILLNKQILIRPQLYVKAFSRVFRSYRTAIKMLKNGPIYLKTSH